VWCGHPNSSLGDQCRLSDGVRETGGSSRRRRARAVAYASRKEFRRSSIT
jgi:hypothetical protein